MNDYKRIQAFQSSKIQSGCEDSNSEDRFSLQTVFGSPQQKIGDFTQTKLGGFNA